MASAAHFTHLFSTIPLPDVCSFLMWCITWPMATIHCFLLPSLSWAGVDLRLLSFAADTEEHRHKIPVSVMLWTKRCIFSKIKFQLVTLVMPGQSMCAVVFSGMFRLSITNKWLVILIFALKFKVLLSVLLSLRLKQHCHNFRHKFPWRDMRARMDITSLENHKFVWNEWPEL